MPKNTKTTNKKRTQVKDLPIPRKEMTQEEKRKVKGGGGGDPGRLRAGVIGPCDNK